MNENDEDKHLYAEIGPNSQISQNVFVANVAVTSGLIGYGLEAQTAPVFLAPFAIIVPPCSSLPSSWSKQRASQPTSL